MSPEHDHIVIVRISLVTKFRCTVELPGLQLFVPFVPTGSVVLIVGSTLGLLTVMF